jgi:Mycotoxin biosynthesis protein UstYa
MHIMHCIDNLRESIMCHADVASLSWQWSERNEGIRVFSDVVHECKDFDAVLQWGKQHYYDAGLDTSGWKDERPPEVGLCGMDECLAPE